MDEIPTAFVFHVVSLYPELVRLAGPCPVCRLQVGSEDGVMLLGQIIALAFAIHTGCLDVAISTQQENLEAAQARRRARDN